MRQNTKTIGDIAELKAAAHLAELGYFISRPLTDNAPYDLIVDIEGQLLKVQVKSRALVKGAVSVGLTRRSHKSRLAYGEGDFDIMALYCSTTDAFAFIPWKEMQNLSSGISLRIDPPKNGQQIGIRYFKEYSEICHSC